MSGNILKNIGFPSKYSITKFVQRFNGKYSSQIFLEFPKKYILCGCEFFQDGYFLLTVGDRDIKKMLPKDRMMAPKEIIGVS